MNIHRDGARYTFLIPVDLCSGVGEVFMWEKQFALIVLFCIFPCTIPLNIVKFT